nr:autotransporter domain-containing protein [Bradyrhizobium sp. 2S1]MCK7667561.1 autotransporter domain-containing protein [Bradyrhizobium sp. 2S1]
MFGKQLAALIATLVAVTLPQASVGQTLFQGYFPSPDSAVSPSAQSVVPNGGIPLANIHAVTGFGAVYGFGSSSTQTLVSPPNGNTPAQYEQQFSPLIGAINTPGSNFPPATNFAAAGTTAQTALLGNPVGCTLKVDCIYQPQVQQFQRNYGKFSPNDIVLQFSGINDFSVSAFGLITSQAVLNQVVAQDVLYQTAMVQQNLALGARNYIFLGLPDLGTFSAFSAPAVSLAPFGLPGFLGGGDPALLTQGSLQVNQQMLANLITLHNQTGANIHYFDTDLLVKEVRSNPTLYGFTVAGVQPNVSCRSLFVDTACSTGPFNVQNQYLSWDGIHYTYRFHNILALAITNQLLAPYTMATQAEMAQAGSLAFAGSLLGRLDAYRYSDAASDAQQTAYNSYAMALKASPKVQPADPLARWSIFAMGTYTHANQNDRLGAAGFDNDLGAGTVGFDYRWSRNLLLGGAFNYSDTSSNINLVGNAHTEVKSYQFAGFASANYASWFSDLVISYGVNNYNINRSGVVDVISASPHGSNLVAAWKAGYLVDTPAVRVGPIGGLTYSHVWIDAYVESGDPLLTQAVSKQGLDGLTGSGGIQFRLPAQAMPGGLNPFLNLTVERDFNGNARVITTAQTYALGLPIATQVTDGHLQTYGKVAGGTSIDLGGRFSALFNAESTFARQGGNLRAVTAGISARL